MDNFKSEPVSQKVEQAIYSKYYNLRHPITMSPNVELSHKVSTLIQNMVYADLYRNRETLNSLTIAFCEILSKCQREEDFQMLSDFMKTLSDTGGYASEFYPIISNLINAQGKEKATILLSKQQPKKEERSSNITNQQYSKNSVEEWKQKYKVAYVLLREYQEKNTSDMVTISLEEINNLISRFSALKTNLIYLSDMFEKDFVSEKNAELEDVISYLKNLQSLMSVETETMDGFHI